MEYGKRMENHQVEKRAIAMLASEYIDDGDALAMNNGTGTLELARCLADTRKHLTVVTNSPDIAIILNGNQTNNVYMTSGYLRKHNKSLVGSMCSECLGNFKVDKSIICIDGISIEDGVTEYNTEEAAILRKILEIGHTKMVLCEFSKFSEVAFNRICHAGQLDYVFTDWNISPREIKLWANINVKVLAALQVNSGK